MKGQCPACKRVVWATAGGNIIRHRDTAGKPCGTSGYPFRITDPELLGVAG